MTVRPNSFDLLRLLAALAVVGGHACELSGHVSADPLARFTGVGGLGSLGVSVFFAISGFLVVCSFARRPNVASFAAARALRLLPALAVVVLVSALLIGPLVTRAPLSAYFTAPQTWLYPIRNILILPVTYHLPGVFAANPYPDAVNGSLWTLRVEVGFYGLTALLGWRGWLGRGVLTGVALLFAAALIAAIGSGRAPLQATLLLRSGVLYFGGGALWAWRGETGWSDPKLRLAAAAAALATVALAVSRTWGDTALALLAPLWVVTLGQTGWPGQRALARVGDLSYGTYLWAFPIQQALVQAQPGVGVAALLGETLLIVLPLAWLSWRLVERPALALKPWAQRRLARFGPRTDSSDGGLGAPDVRIMEAEGAPQSASIGAMAGAAPPPVATNAPLRKPGLP